VRVIAAYYLVRISLAAWTCLIISDRLSGSHSNWRLHLIKRPTSRSSTSLSPARSSQTKTSSDCLRIVRIAMDQTKIIKRVGLTSGSNCLSLAICSSRTPTKLIKSLNNRPNMNVPSTCTSSNQVASLSMMTSVPTRMHQLSMGNSSADQAQCAQLT